MFNNIKIGDLVCLKCGSPSFVVKGYARNNDLILLWFNAKTSRTEEIKAAPALVLSIEEFNDRKIEIEAKSNNRLYKLPDGITIENTITIGFEDRVHRDDFLKLVYDQQIKGRVLDEPDPNLVN